MDSLLEDVRLALRALAKRRGFTLVAALSIALGIGFNAAIFSAVNALLLRPVPGIGEPERVVEVGRTDRGEGFDSFSYPDFLDLREGVAELSELAAWRMQSLSYGAAEGGERVMGMAVSPGYFEAVGAAPVLGRGFGPEEDAPGVTPAVVVVSDRFWRERLGAADDVVGSTVDVNRTAWTVIGVAPRGFSGHFPLVAIDLWVPIARMDVAEPGFRAANYEERRNIWHQVVGRLAPGTTVERADAAVKAAMARLAELHPESNETRSAAVIPLGPVPGGGRTVVRGFLGALMGLVALVLLVAAANVGGMLLARGAAREKEIAIRLAIGSGRGRLIRQLVTESVILFLLGAAGGFVLAWWGTALVGGISVPGVEIALDISPDLTVLLFALSVALVTGLAFGLVPALQASRPDLVPALKDEGRTGRRGGRTRRLFVAVQVGLAVVLLTAGGLLVRSLQEAHRVEQGFDPAGVHLVTLDLSLDGYSPEAAIVFQTQLARSIRGHAGFSAVALAHDLPMDLSEQAGPAWPEGREDDAGRAIGADFNVVSPGYFETLRIPVLRGRAFSEADGTSAEPVVVVSETFAREVWGDADAVGHRLRWGGRDAQPRTVVGVVGDVKNQTLGETVEGMVYVPLAQRHTAAVHLLARGPAVGSAALRRAVLEADPRLTVPAPQRLADITSIGLLPARVAAYVAGLLGVLGLFLAALGVYGVIAHGVVQRRREIGIRMAVGAAAERVLRDVVGDGFRLALPGLILGGLAAAGVARLLRSMLFGVSPADPVAAAVVAAVLVTAVGLASWLPARRAAAVDPMEALRSE